MSLNFKIPLAIIFTFSMRAMIGQAQKDSCNCLLNLNYMASKLKNNYAGYHDKVYASTQQQHDKLLDSLKQQAKQVSDAGTCSYILEKYRQFFYDKHLQLGYKDVTKASDETKAKDTLAKITSKEQASEIEWSVLPSGTLYIRLESCKLNNKPVLDSLIKVNKESLKSIANWMIDFRGNTGGSTDFFSGLLPYLYTKPYIPLGKSYWMTADATAKFADLLKENERLFDSKTAIMIKDMLHFAAKNPNGWYSVMDDTLAFNTVLAYPKRVAILSDKYNASSGETFLIMAKGISDKVTIFGENSGGFLDYGDLLPYQLPCPSFLLWIPSRRANYLDHGITYDKSGYPPDIYIKEKDVNWIEFVQNYWNGQYKIDQ